MSRIAAVVVTYNRKEKLSRCIEAVLGQDSPELPDLFIVDNGSTDGTSDMIRCKANELEADHKTNMNQSRKGLPKRTPQIIYIDLCCNRGGAAGFSCGIRRAAELGYDFIWVMDDDCIPSPDALSEFLKYETAHKGEYGFLSSKVLWKDKSLHLMNIQRETVFRSVSKERLSNASEAIRIEMASFVSLFLPTESVIEAGLPIGEFYIYTDDWEYTRRISYSHKCFLIPSSTVVHDTDANLPAGIAVAASEQKDRYRYMYRNDVYLYRREGIKGFCYEALRLSWHSIKVLKSSESVLEKLDRLRIMYRATCDGLHFCPEPDAVFIQDDKKVEKNQPQGMKVLEAFGEPISYGGQERFVMEMLAHMDRTGIKFDLLTPYYCDNETIRSCIKEYGGSLYELGCRFRPGGFRNGEVFPIERFLKNKSYDVIHIHSGSSSMLALYAVIAANAGIPRVIVHSHCTGISGWKHRLVKQATKNLLKKYPTDHMACSKEAGEWRFSYDICSKRLKIIKNGIDPEVFKFREDIRNEVRSDLKIDEDCRVIACIGRLTAQKNQRFLMHIFSMMASSHGTADRYKLMIVGSGEDNDMLHELAHKLGINKDVIFIPATEKVSDYYMAADVLAMPSLYEGFGIVAAEAQASGLHVIASENVPKSAAFSGSISFIQLADISSWVDALSFGYERHPENSELIKGSSFDISVTAEQIRSCYLNDLRAESTK